MAAGVVTDMIDRDAIVVAGEAVASARRRAARAQYELAAACLEYADLRGESERNSGSARGAMRSRPGDVVTDELALMLRQQPWPVRCLVARSRRIRASLPTVWEAFSRGAVDAEQVVMIDRVARRITENGTLHAVDARVVEAAQSRSPKQLGAWLMRLVVRLEPDAFAARHRRALADRRVTVAQGPDGIGYVTGEITATDAAEIDSLLAAAARNLGANDPRTEQQRRADVFTDLLLGRLLFTDGGSGGQASDEVTPDGGAGTVGAGAPTSWIEVEDIDPDTGELLGTRRQPVDSDGHPIDKVEGLADEAISLVRRPQTRRIGIVVPLSSLLGLTDAPAELADRSGLIPADDLRETIADLLGTSDAPPDAPSRVLFTRLLTDDGGRILDVAELGRYPSRRLAEAVRIRAGTCRHATCTVPADRCDLDHRVPHPRGPTSGDNLDPFCRRHHRGKTFAGLASRRDWDTITWTLPDDTTYRVVDDPLPTGNGPPTSAV